MVRWISLVPPGEIVEVLRMDLIDLKGNNEVNSIDIAKETADTM